MALPELAANLTDEPPEYTRFFTPQVHRQRARRLDDRHSVIKYVEVGRSEADRPIHAVTIGEGSQTAVILGGAHANEPIGSMTCDYLLHRLAKFQALRERFDYEFVFIPVADVDGARLNQGWFDGPFTPMNYALNFYRPDPSRDVEWRFPFEYKDLRFDDPPPENQAIASVLRDYAPDFIGSLHNSAVGSCFHCLSEASPELYTTLQEIPPNHGVPLSYGEPDTPYMEELADGIYTVPTTKKQYEYIADHGEIPPGEIQSGGGTLDFARDQNPDAVQLFTEVPYWTAQPATDQSPVGRTRREVMLEGLDRREAIASCFAEIYDEVGDLLDSSRLADLVARYAETDDDIFDQKRARIRDNSQYEEEATRAQEWSQRTMQPFARLLYGGPVLRAIETALDQTTTERHRATLQTAHRRVEDKLQSEMANLRPSLEHERVPIRDAVLIQAQSMLTGLIHFGQNEE